MSTRSSPQTIHTDRELGQRVRVQRLAQRLSQEQLAAQLGVPRWILGEVERLGAFRASIVGPVREWLEFQDSHHQGPGRRRTTWIGGATTSTMDMDEKTLIKKADLCTMVARMILRHQPHFTIEQVEWFAVALMYLPPADLINVASLLARNGESDVPRTQ